ncbi:type III secretion inner membrane ring lipoprotein SctJ [Sphingomonas sp. AP4-R1]|uniref:type III secretion system inner membrane ring lipoprotein SctJ n=1 Tax=Sphingomonas sp. AP4-R1 TaxID=2735134 RepID=UPI0014933C62|nr:type III secretion inner membrane ring lipoprotein SctJ [Sphingomonas sp. AP4-R1]QJU59902.1 type III secretion inner membrane ring lipoprotein SctJ [Sphingomonas sp. AP4-R1]
MMTCQGRGGLAMLIAFALLLAGCGRADLYSKLTEAQANDMIAVLQSAGISANKEDGGETGWTVSAAPGDFSRAIAVLRSQGLPREDFSSLGTVFKKEGFVSSPVEERARLNYGMSQELAHTISDIDGVVQARVHLALPQKDPMADAKEAASASVFIKYRPGANIEAQVGKVKALVVNSVEGLKYDNVSVETFPAEPLPGQAPGTPGSVIAANFAYLLLPLVFVLGLLTGYPALRRWQQRRQALVRREPRA